MLLETALEDSTCNFIPVQIMGLEVETNSTWGTYTSQVWVPNSTGMGRGTVEIDGCLCHGDLLT